MSSSLTGVSMAPPSYGSSNNNGSEPPKKYIKIDGVTQLNPEYKRLKEGKDGKPATTALYPEALPVVSTMDDAMALNEESRRADGTNMPISTATSATIEMLQEPDIATKVGVSSDAIVDGLSEIFARYEVPIGLMNKLMQLTEYDEMEFMVDDSGSMGSRSDTKDENGHRQTRWSEAKNRLKSMMEVLAYVPHPKISIVFFNRRERVEIVRTGQTPERFLEEAYKKIEDAFRHGPRGGTPALEKMRESLQRGQGKRVARYLFCDGEPNGGEHARDEITKMLTNRRDPQGNPYTFLSCSEDDDEVEWMKEAEEVAPYAAEYDDFKSEAGEVHGDQGRVLPFTKGFYLVAQLIGAMNPDDLDAMDESVPFTKFTLDNLLGVEYSEQDYRKYWEGFMDAQRNRKLETKMDKVKAKFNWDRHYNEFLRGRLAKNIDVVREFKEKLEKASRNHR